MSSIDRVLNTCLAIGLGITGTLVLQSSEAEGYPSTAISSGHNPVVSMGGTITGDGSLTVFEADSDSDIVVTDLVLSLADTSYRCTTSYIATLRLSDDTIVATVTVGLGINSGDGTGYMSLAPLHFQSGIRVPAGDTLRIETNRTLNYGCGSNRLTFTASGYTAQP